MADSTQEATQSSGVPESPAPACLPMIREMDALCRQYAYRREEMDFYPQELWVAIQKDSQVYTDLHLAGRPEPALRAAGA